MTDGATSAPRYVAGVGASAGGLQALERLFSAMPDDTEIAFVVVQHLAPDFESMMDELLARKTKLPVRRVTDGMRLARGTIYLIPPGKEMIISSGLLLLADRAPDAHVSSLIDTFLRSLARDAGERSIGIVLSGGGSDGAAGVRAIHEAGGLVLVQAPQNAEVDGMPTAAIATGTADLVLTPEEMPASLVRYTQQLVQPEGEAEPQPARDRAPLQTVLDLVRERVGVDFSHYKPTTVARRIHRRLMFHPARRMEDFVDRLANEPSELDALYNDLLIGVTQFFRDPETWNAVSELALPAAIRDLERGGELRAWVAGCATGEEAYSLALLMREHIEELGREDITVKIFATDVHPEALELANRGLYSTESLECLSEARRARWFTRQGEIWRVAPVLRQMIVFARHDVTSDPPFTRLHLVTCRNLLIYLKPESQRKVISLFHFGLLPGGTLLLGSSETTHGADEGFETLDRTHKLFRRRKDLRLPPTLRSRSPIAEPHEANTSSTGGRPSMARMLALYDRLLEQSMPPSVLVDHQLNLLHTFGGAGKFLRVNDGRPSSSLLNMVDADLRMPLTGAVKRCLEGKNEVAYTSALPESGERSRIVVRPVTGPKVDRPCLLVSFETAPSPPGEAIEREEIELDDVSKEQVQRLEDELQHTRENLHATIEELETSNEELQATNEELLASNEELQSTNEELQSVNEELYTVNAELQDKIAQLTELANDMDNLFAATDVGTIFLDEQLCIRKFTPAIAETFHLLPRDVGRPIASFTHRLDDPRLLEDLEDVLQHRARLEREVQDLDGNWLFLRILPYQADGDTHGVVLTLVDISTLKQAENALFRERHLLRSLMEIVPDPISFKDAQGRFVRVNSAFAEALGLSSPAHAVGKRLMELRPGHDSLVTESKDQHIVATGEPILDDLEEDRDVETGSRRWRLTSTLALRDEDGRAVGTLGISRDITAQKVAENEAHAAVRRRDRFLATLSHELRNPLAAICSAAEVLVDGSKLPTELARPTSIIRRQSSHMARMLDDLLDVARVMQDEIRLQRTPVDLVEIARGCIECAEVQLEGRELRLIGELPERPVGVNGDRQRLQQCVDNLLANAIAHSRPKGRIWIRIEATDDAVRLTLRDEGIGIEANLLDAIFEPFVQADQSLHRSAAGMGLGLALVRAIVDKHGGRIVAQSDGPGTGAAFVVTLPRCELDQRPRQERSGGDLQGLRVVVVEDEHDNREMLSTILELAGCSVLAASDGAEGLEMIRRARPQVALIDLGLPKLDGFEVARRIRRELDEELRLVAISGYGQPEDLRRAHQSGFDMHIVKPVTKDALLRILSKAASVRRPVENP